MSGCAVGTDTDDAQQLMVGLTGISLLKTAHLVEIDVQWVAHSIVGSHDSEFLERAPRTVTHITYLDIFTHLVSFKPMGNDW